MTHTMASIETTRFGKIDCAEQDVVHFSEGLLGFDNAQRFVVIQHKEGSPFCWLQSLDKGDLAFLVVDPAIYVANYAPEMPERVAEDLELKEETPRLVYTIVTIPHGKPDDMSLNLAGPLLINVESRKAKQVVLDPDVYPLKAKVLTTAKQEGDAA